MITPDVIKHYLGLNEKLRKMGSDRVARAERENKILADRYSEQGSVRHFMLRQGFAVRDECQAEEVLMEILKQWELKS